MLDQSDFDVLVVDDPLEQARLLAAADAAVQDALAATKADPTVSIEL